MSIEKINQLAPHDEPAQQPIKQWHEIGTAAGDMIAASGVILFLGSMLTVAYVAHGLDMSHKGTLYPYIMTAEAHTAPKRNVSPSDNVFMHLHVPK